MPCARHCNEGPQPEVINLSQLEYNKSKCPIEEGTCVLCQEILGVEKDIADTVARLKDLLSHHQRLKTDINRTHSPIIRDLPVEVLSRIFKACFPDNTNDITDDDWEPGHKHVAIPLRIGAVCRTWRHIAWSSPELWTGVLLSRRFNSSSRVCDQYGIIKEWISRSGALPLNVYVYEEEDEAEDLDVVDYSWERIADECRCWEMSLEILALSSNRWKDATLNLSTYSFECIASTSKLKPPIRNLNLSSSGDCGWQPLESKWKDGLKLWQEFSSSGPQHVTTDLPVRFKTFNLNWQHVRRVETDGWSLQDCLDLLKSSPHLFSCSFAFVLEYEEDPEPRPDEPVTCHASLNELSLQCSDAAHFFDHVTLPSLEVLTYPTDSLKDEPMQKDDPSLMSFFTRSSFPLVALSVAAHMFTPEYMVTILGTIPCLGCLKLSCSDSPELVDDTETVMAFFLEHLAATATFTNEAGSNSSGKFLPELESLELNGAWEFGFFWSIAADIFGDPSEVGAEGRRPLKSLELHTWEPSPVAGLSEEMVARFRSLKEAGVTIDYLVGPGLDKIVPVTWEYPLE
ncbi:hypothetical protein D9613_004472 [Agrocybe pediades]|uniref:F-box domain-containing protein n=1 Tax=Agrocybe pediades TaxID=84607 RepID=A0A8H4QIM6_9AGAR|nr:hypothetical protein D9613_004472 [Agrocybe pediades]